MVLVANFFYTMLLLTSCGVVKGTYVAYDKDGNTSTSTSTASGASDDCNSAAQELFDSSIQNSITQTCSNCHGPGGQSSDKLLLDATENSQSASNLRNYCGTDASKLVDKLSPGGGHGGGNLIGNAIEAASIESWISKLNSCE